MDSPRATVIDRSPVRSDRLELIPMSPEFLRASLEGRLTEAARLIGATLPDGWPDWPDLLEMRLGQLKADPFIEPWLLRAMVPVGTGVMVGHIGFHTAPGSEYLAAWSPAAAELGYTVFPAFQRQGYAREAAIALMDWAQLRHGVTEFIVSISPDNLPSLALAAGLGFRRIGSHIDEIDGLEDILELRRTTENRSKES